MNISNVRLPNRIMTLEQCDFGKFTTELLSMDNRFRFMEMAYDITYHDGKSDKDVSYLIYDNHIYLPCVFPPVQHEIAHMVEIPLPRLMLPDWGLSDVSRIIYKHPKEKVKTFFAAFSREIRVRAIQRIITANKEVPLATYVRAMHSEVHPDTSNVSAFDNETWTNAAIGYMQHDIYPIKTKNQLEDWIINLHNKTIKSWSVERIRYEWTRRLNIIQNAMETNRMVA